MQHGKGLRGQNFSPSFVEIKQQEISGRRCIYLVYIYIYAQYINVQDSERSKCLAVPTNIYCIADCWKKFAASTDTFCWGWFLNSFPLELCLPHSFASKSLKWAYTRFPPCYCSFKKAKTFCNVISPFCLFPSVIFLNFFLSFSPSPDEFMQVFFVTPSRDLDRLKERKKHWDRLEQKRERGFVVEWCLVGGREIGNSSRKLWNCHLLSFSGADWLDFTWMNWWLYFLPAGQMTWEPPLPLVSSIVALFLFQLKAISVQFLYWMHFKKWSKACITFMVLIWRACDVLSIIEIRGFLKCFWQTADMLVGQFRFTFRPF